MTRQSRARGRALNRTYEQAVRELTANDTVLGRLIERVGPCGLGAEQKPRTTTFEALLEAITHQQLSLKAAATIFGRVKTLSPELDPESFLDIDESALRAAGLSGAKVLAVHDLAKRSCNGEVPSMKALDKMDNQSIVSTLSKVRGIGRWSAEMLLMFRLGRLDVLPTQDLGIQQGFAASFRKSNKPIAKAIEHRGERWRPYRSVVSWYLWRAAEQARDKSKR